MAAARPSTCLWCCGVEPPALTAPLGLEGSKGAALPLSRSRPQTRHSPLVSLPLSLSVSPRHLFLTLPNGPAAIIQWIGAPQPATPRQAPSQTPSQRKPPSLRHNTPPIYATRCQANYRPSPLYFSPPLRGRHYATTDQSRKITHNTGTSLPDTTMLHLMEQRDPR